MRSVMYYTHRYLEDRPVYRIPVYWKIMHVSGLLVSSITGFLSFLILKTVFQNFENDCVLFSKLETELTNLSEWRISAEYSTWGSRFDCEFPMIVSLFSFIYGSILMVFFLMCGSGSRVIQQG